MPILALSQQTDTKANGPVVFEKALKLAVWDERLPAGTVLTDPPRLDTYRRKGASQC